MFFLSSDRYSELQALSILTKISGKSDKKHRFQPQIVRKYIRVIDLMISEDKPNSGSTTINGTANTSGTTSGTTKVPVVDHAGNAVIENISKGGASVKNSITHALLAIY